MFTVYFALQLSERVKKRFNLVQELLTARADAASGLPLRIIVSMFASRDVM
jgi:hypothetical protein